jgi:hypothetical protein
MNIDLISKLLPYLIIAIFAIFAACMTIEIHDINAELDRFKKIIAEYEHEEIKLNR